MKCEYIVGSLKGRKLNRNNSEMVDEKDEKD